MAMIKKLLFTLSLCMLVGNAIYAQSTIKGVIKDANGGPLQYLQVLLKQDDKVVNMAITDDAGSYQIFGIAAGTYDISTLSSITCATSHTEKGVYVSSSEVKFVNITINCSTELEFVEVIYVPPVFSQDNTTSAQKLTGDEVRKTPGRSITAALANLGGVSSVDGRMTSVRGNRSDGQVMIIDGVRARGNTGITMSSIESAELIQGGIPAEYGDATSVAVITTRGVGKDYHGSAELRASLEGYGQFTGSVSVSGPILKGKTPQDPARMGFFFSAEGDYNIDSQPAAGGTWVAKPSVIKDISAKPIDYRFENNTFARYYRTSELGPNDFKKTRVRQNAEDWGFIAQGKIDVMGGGKDARGRPKNNLRFSLSGSYQYIQARDWGLGSALFNSKNNGIVTNNTLRLSARLNHRVKTDTAANAILKNVMYDININYTLFNRKNQDINHKDNLFGYGYIGKFTSSRSDKYVFLDEYFWQDSIKVKNIWKLDQYQTVDNVSFDPNGYLKNGKYYNPDLVPYTKNFVDFIDKVTEGNPGSWGLNNDVYQSFGALLNGDAPPSVANRLFQAPGVPNSDFEKGKQEAIGAKATLSLNIQDHEVKFGFELEKLTNRSYSISARSLWYLMRQLTYGTELRPMDFGNPYWKWGGNIGPADLPNGDTLMYPILTDKISNFDLNLRQKLGITERDKFLDVNSYDPAIYSLDLFSNYELLNMGNNYVSYNGYDYTGKISNKKINLKNFFCEDELKPGEKIDLNKKGRFNIGAFEPIYLALFLQDKFSISNLLFNVGLRLDYFNANQYVLKDPFLLKGVRTVQDIKNEWTDVVIPDNVGANWIPYVSIADFDIKSAPHTIVAYRNGKTWYNSLGQEVADPMSYLGTGGPVLNKLSDPDNPARASSNAFRNYKPQWNLMPRISFSFPVSTNSLFYAHYNIIATRPTNLQMNPIAYLFIDKYNNSDNIISNPNLRAQRSVDYEIGFRQKVGENAALNICAYYSEKRDQIQSYRFTGAYPNTYYSYENQDFGTVQGFMLEMTMRGTKNLTFRASYTLQFAKGTGSSSGSNLAIIASGQPNLRTLTNLSFDQRHRITANIDLRFDQGVNYNGPITVKQKKGTDTKKEIRWFENAGVTLLLSAASGMPYSRSGVVYSALGWGERTKPQLQGAVNGANMPWTFQCDVRIEKAFILNLASKKDKNESGKRNNKPGLLSVYLDFVNILNIKNVQSVYQYTGSAKDDGYLSSSLFQQYQVKGDAFSMPFSSAENYYRMAIANPYNYTQPFRVYLGVIFSF